MDGLIEYGEDYSLPFKAHAGKVVATLYRVGEGMPAAVRDLVADAAEGKAPAGGPSPAAPDAAAAMAAAETPAPETPAEDRSEAHTSELQSLMRISYAVFCLKKKKTNTT